MDYKMYRCKFMKETQDYIIGKDIFNENTYYIIKNEATKTFKIGFDNSFYAKKQKAGMIFKKNILEAIDYEKIARRA